MAVPASALDATELQKSLEIVTETNRSAVESQQKIDRLSQESQALLDEYQRLQNNAEYQAAYTLELQHLKAAQESRIETLQQQIGESKITQQRIVPMMRSMADALEKFVVLDLPFHHEERITSVLKLKQRLRQPDLPLSVKFRLLLESWQLELDYGVTIDAWRGPIVLEDDTYSVEYLRIGRTALYYQSLDGLSSGYWNASAREWAPLDEQYNHAVKDAIRVARKQMAPRLLSLPLAPPGPSP